MADTPAEPERGHNEADAIAVGQKVIEMAERLKVAHLCSPGAVASWGFSDGATRFQLKMVVSS